MPLESLYFNLSTRKFVRSVSGYSSDNRTPPIFGHGDMRDFGVTFVVTNGNRIQVVQSVVSAQIGISSPSAPTVLITSVTAGAADNNEFPFVLNCNTAGMDGFMSGVTETKEAIGQFRIVTALGENRYSFTLYIEPKQLASTTVDSTPDDPGLRKSEANAVYIPKEVPTGTRMLWTDEVTGQRYAVGFANGQFKADLL